VTLSTDAAGLDLARFLRPGDRIVWSQACGEPTSLVQALNAQAAGIGRLSAFAATSFSGLLDVDAAGRYAISSMGAIGALRNLSAAHRLGIVPCHVSQVGPMIEQGLIGCDVAFAQVSPADEQGMHSFGLTNDFVHAAVAKARVVIAEVNECVPYTYGDVMLPAAKIDCAVQVARTPVEVLPAAIGETDQAIARIVAGYIEDGAVLQVGIGAVPDAILRLLHDRRDLGVHSGMIGDGLVDLVEAGVVTNARKPIDPGVSITTTLIGSRRLYEFAHRNPRIAVRSSGYTHDAAVLSRLPRFVTINSAVEVDLSGQVNGEVARGSYVGAVGGALDFVRAANQSPGGLSITVIPASRIVERLSGPVSVPRSETGVVVTEHGVADLRGCTLAERERRLRAVSGKS